MNREDVIRWAREAGLLVIGTADGGEAVYTWPQGITDELERFAALVAAAEREACAKVCDAAYDEFFAKHELEYPKSRYDKASVTRTVKAAVEFVTEDVAAAIRARKDNT